MLTNTLNRLSQHSTVYSIGLISALAYGYLAFRSQSYGQAGLLDLWLVSGLCASLSLLVFIRYRSQNKTIPMLEIVGFAVLFRLIGLIAFPVLEDDFYRYLWDGFMAIEFGSPYGLAPAHFFDSNGLTDQFERILDSINYPYIATIYGPVCQWLFALGYLIAPGEVWPLQVLFSLADMVIIILLIKLTKHSHWLLLYAWSPLLIKEFAFTAHPDIVGVMFLMMAFYSSNKGQLYRMALYLALACGVKVFALILVPFLIAFRWKIWLVFIMSILLIGWPWGIQATWFPEGLQAMADNWLFNAPLYIYFLNWFSLTSIKLTLLSLFALFCGFYFLVCWQKKQLSEVRADYLFGLFFLCLPAFNPWYLAWLLPFAVLYPSRWAWAASISVLLAYASGINLNNESLQLYEIPNWLIFAEFSIIFVFVLLDLHKGFNKKDYSL